MENLHIGRLLTGINSGCCFIAVRLRGGGKAGVENSQGVRRREGS